MPNVPSFLSLPARSAGEPTTSAWRAAKRHPSQPPSIIYSPIRGDRERKRNARVLRILMIVLRDPPAIAGLFMSSRNQQPIHCFIQVGMNLVKAQLSDVDSAKLDDPGPLMLSFLMGVTFLSQALPNPHSIGHPLSHHPLSLRSDKLSLPTGVKKINPCTRCFD